MVGEDTGPCETRQPRSFGASRPLPPPPRLAPPPPVHHQPLALVRPGLRNGLFSPDEADIRAPLRGGAPGRGDRAGDPRLRRIEVGGPRDQHRPLHPARAPDALDRGMSPAGNRPGSVPSRPIRPASPPVGPSDPVPSDPGGPIPSRDRAIDGRNPAFTTDGPGDPSAGWGETDRPGRWSDGDRGAIGAMSRFFSPPRKAASRSGAVMTVLKAVPLGEGAMKRYMLGGCPWGRGRRRVTQVGTGRWLRAR